MDAVPRQHPDRENGATHAPADATADSSPPAWLCGTVQPLHPAPILKYVPHACLGFGLLAIGVLWTVIFLGLKTLERAEMEAVDRVLANLARSFEGHVERSLFNIDQILTVVAQESQRNGMPTDLGEVVGHRLGDDPLFNHVAVADARGEVRAATAAGPSGNLADQEFFAAQRQRPDGGLLISQPAAGRGGKTAILLSQRISGRDGNFAGVAVASVDPEYFTSFYAGFDLGAGGSVTLIGLDGIVRARHTQGGAAPIAGIGQDVASPELRRLAELNSTGTYRGASQVDGVRRFYAYRVMAHFPLAVVVGKAEEHVLAGLEQRRRELEILGAAVTGIIILLSAFLFRQSRQLYRSELQTCAALAQVRLNAKVFEESSDGIMITDADNNIVAVNRAFSAITQYEAAEVIGRNPRFLSAGTTAPEVHADLWRSLAASGRWQGEVVNRRKDGEKFPEWLSINVVRDASGAVTNYIGIFSDATARRFDRRRLHFMVHYDPLTDLPNRLLLFDRLNQAIAGARREGGGVAVLFLDLDQFKPINDNYGHAVGDRYLQAVAGRWRAVIRETDTLARLGGDEFILVVTDVDCRNYAERVAEKCRQVFAEPFLLDGWVIRGSVSIGVALYPDDGEDGQALVIAADHAMYSAKQAGRGVVRGA